MSAEEWVQPEWWGPLPDWVGGLLGDDVVVGHSETGVVYVKELTVYPNGIGFELCARLRGEDPPEPPPDPDPPQPLRILSADSEPRRSIGVVAMTEEEEEDLMDEPLPTDRVRLAVEFGDGRRAERDAPVGGPGDFSIRAFQEGKPVAPDPRANVVLNFSGGGGGPRLPLRAPLPLAAARQRSPLQLRVGGRGDRQAARDGPSRGTARGPRASPLSLAGLRSERAVLRVHLMWRA